MVGIDNVCLLWYYVLDQFDWIELFFPECRQFLLPHFQTSFPTHLTFGKPLSPMLSQ